jgi:predicted TIM-barrel fold metal-dependent hydrolase
VVDRRQRHWLDSARDLSLSEIEAIIKQCPDTNFILTNGSGWENSQLAQNEFCQSCNFLIAISRLTSVLQESIPRLLDTLGPTKLAFGTGIPFKYPRPAMLKMEILTVSEEVKERIYWRNVAEILG